jgi:DNA-binding GntR family transcriptional regulator
MASTSTRAEVIADHLRRAVRAGEYISGERLVELTLSQQLGVSQNTVRDALHLLIEEGWVVKLPRRGTFVRAFSRDEAVEVYALWAAVEAVALRWALNSLTKSRLNAMRRLVKQARQYAFTGDMRRCVEALMNLHALVAAAANRPQTAALLARLRNQVHLLETLRQMRAPRSAHAQEAQLLLYEKLLSLMERGEAAAAVDLLRYLISTDCETLLPLLT